MAFAIFCMTAIRVEGAQYAVYPVQPVGICILCCIASRRAGGGPREPRMRRWKRRTPRSPYPDPRMKTAPDEDARRALRCFPHGGIAPGVDERTEGLFQRR